MCQLTFINLGNKKYNQLLEYLTAFVNSSAENKDGYGYYSADVLYKSKQTPNILTNMGEMVAARVKTAQPILGHVRKASVYAKNITDENAHPFEGERFVLAHNGTLESRDNKLEKEKIYERRIDSYIFHDILENVARENPEKSVPELLNLAYDKFYGKFAFLFYDKKSKSFYAARGETAELYVVNVEIQNNDGKIVKGYVVNTNRETLMDALLLFTNTLQITYGAKINWNYNTNWIEILPANSIFSLNRGNVEKIGEIKEQRRPTQVEENRFLPTTAGRGIEKTSTFENKLTAILDKYFIDLEYLDAVFVAWFGKGMAYFSDEELAIKLKVVEKEFSRTLTSNEKKILQFWKNIRYKTADQYDDLEIHTNFDVTFPYTKIANLNELRFVLQKLKK